MRVSRVAVLVWPDTNNQSNVCTWFISRGSLSFLHSSPFLIFCFLSTFLKSFNMSGHDNEDLIDYEEDHDIPNVGAAAATNGGVTATVGDAEGKDKKNFSGIHSTGFRSVFCTCVPFFSAYLILLPSEIFF